ncbi:MAG: hypothetical protein EXS32_01830 [Opitutus sp.]|nr:hypothetical protein [Opitutus sp.]
MLGALLYLRLTSLKNLLLSRVRRLKQPKYLVGAIVGIGYFYLMFFRRFGAMSSRPRPSGLSLAALPVLDLTAVFATIGALALLVIAAFAWALPSDKPGLAFTEAEVAFLFSAPISRRWLIHFKVLGAQLRILLSALFFTLISSQWSFLGGNALMHAVGWWVLLSALNLHLTGAALTISRLVEGGVSTTRRRVLVAGLVGAVIVGTVAMTWQSAPAFTPRDRAGPGAILAYVARLIDTGVLHWLLWPGKLLVGPFLASGAGAFFRALGPALLLLAAHYFWVVRSETSFEEASIALAEKRAARVARIRSGNFQLGTAKPKARREPFHLRGRGRPELAFLWKNLLSTRPYFHWRVWLVTAGLIAWGVTWGGRQDPSGLFAGIVATFAALFAGYTLLIGPQLARQDLRGDLSNTDILKTYPLAGWQLLLGQLLTPIAILTGLLWLALLAAALALAARGGTISWLTPGFRPTAGLCLALTVPPLVTLQLLVPNAAALVFPAWFQATRQRGGGIDLMGQRLIFGVGQMLTMVLALVPAVLVAGALVFLTQWLIGLPAAVVLATLVVLAILVGEIWCGLWWLGGRFEKLDLSAELRP